MPRGRAQVSMVSITSCSGLSTLIVLDFSLLTKTSPVAAAAAAAGEHADRGQGHHPPFHAFPPAPRAFSADAAAGACAKSIDSRSDPSAAIPILLSDPVNL